MAIHRTEPKFIKAADEELGNFPLTVLLSPMDLLAPNVHVPMIFSFHQAPEEAESQLEKGLALALSQYKEFAGRLGTDDKSGRPCIHLSNAGVPLILANCITEEMDQYLASRRHDDLQDLLPMLSLAGSINRKDLLQIPFLAQITRFSCGGLTLGIERLHRVADGTCNANFLVDWSASSRYSKQVVSVPILHDRSHTMPNQLQTSEYEHPEYAPDVYNFKLAPRNSTMMVSVTFDKHKLASLKSECGNAYTTYVSLSAHIWRCITRARGLSTGTMTKLAVPIDGRRALDTPKGFFGNAVFRGLTRCEVGELLDRPIAHAASLIHEAIKVASDPNRLRSAINFLDMAQKSKTSTGSLASSTGDAGESLHVLSLGADIVSTSWSRFPLYDQDFGFGFPTSLTTSLVGVEGALAIAPTSSKDGSVEVFVTVFKDQADILLSLL